MSEINYLVAYNGGSYGNFISWSLIWATNIHIPIDQRPWGEDGNSHNWIKNMFDTVEQAISSPPIPGSLLHPRHHADDDLHEILTRMLTIYDKIIFIYPTRENFIWNINNKAYKAFGDGWLDDWVKKHTHAVDSWGDQKKEAWALREWLSLYMISQHYHEVEYDTCLTLSNEKIMKISLEEIKTSFPELLSKLADFIEKPLIRSKEEIIALYSEWYLKQKHIDKDSIVARLVDDILNGKEASMDDLTIIDQAEIQRVLRDIHGYEIRCFGLNEWPSTTSKLIPLLFKKDSDVTDDAH